MKNRLERLWSGGQLSPFMIPVSWVYGLIVAIRNKLYDWKILKTHRVKIPVISIGNVAIGGTGKTPLTLFLAEELAKDRRVAIVSRGYRGEAERERDPVVVSAGNGPLMSWKRSGDEPYLLAEKLPGVIVIAGRDRVAGARLAQEMGAEVVILDDGMQHRRLARDVEIAVDDGEARHLFPRGRLRESRGGLERASLVVDPEFIAHCDPPLEGKHVGLFCAIGRPERFVRTVETLGAHIVAEQCLPDHDPIDGKALALYATRAKAAGAEMLVCTEKDWVKCSGELPLPVACVKLQLLPTDGLLEKVKNLLPPPA